jgi:hypothetical protein
MREGAKIRKVIVTRRGRALNVWVSENHKERLDELAERTRVTRSELVRQALELLFDRADGGQLRIGFPAQTGESGSK